jgi:uncharacterized protein YjbI with pentapeptide repeats
VQCQFASTYYDYEAKVPGAKFECKEEDLGTGFCIFHDSNYLQDKNNFLERRQEVTKGLMDKVTDSVAHDKALFCMGYYLPDIKIEGDFTKPVYFSDAKFQQADFSGANFFGVADFHSAKFSQRVYFNSAKFSQLADFNSAKYIGVADFNSAKFIGVASFNSAEFSQLARFYSAEFFGEARFYSAEFSQRVYFDSAKFSQLASFNSAKFIGVASFNSAKFFREASFHSTIFFDESDYTRAMFKRVSFSESRFSKEANFRQGNYIDEADFSDTIFCSGADFYRSIFSNAAYFSATFKSETFFNYITFGNPSKVTFESEDMSKVSFINTNITKIAFSDKTTWSGKDKFTIIEEQWLEDNCSRKNNIEKRTKVSLGGVLSVYRNLRENYEFRLQFDEAGKFFIREMELKRNYRQVAVTSSSSPDFTIKKNCPFRRNILSLVGWYHLLSNYGESLWRPTVAGFLIVFSFTFFFVTQSNPASIPSFYNVFLNRSLINSGNNNNATHSFANNTKVALVVAAKPNTNYSNFVGLEQVRNPIQWQKAFERAMGDFIPLLSLPSEVKIGLIDYVIKIVGGALTFGLIAIALRRKFERKYTR